MNIEFRTAMPSDVEPAIPLIYSSGSHEYDYAFAVGGHTGLDYIKFSFVTGSSTESYGSYRVALVDGRLVGIGSFLGGAAFNTVNEVKIAWQILRFYGLPKCWTVMRRGTQLQKLEPPPEKDAVFIQKLGVSEDMRGRGIGTALLSRQINIARVNGFRRCVLDVAVTNQRAQLLYERLGFRVVEERKGHVTGSAIHVPDQKRMELLL